jgi:hypothetical protein
MGLLQMVAVTVLVVLAVTAVAVEAEAEQGALQGVQEIKAVTVDKVSSLQTTIQVEAEAVLLLMDNLLPQGLKLVLAVLV